MSQYKKLVVWQKSIELTVLIYSLTKLFPKEEIYWITSQIRRAVVSIPSNIAEWYWRNGKIEYRQFLWIAKGASMELETQLVISLKLWYLNEKDYDLASALNTEIIKMLTTIISKLLFQNYRRLLHSIFYILYS